MALGTSGDLDGTHDEPLVLNLELHLVTAGGTAARSGRVTTRRTLAPPRGRLVRGRFLSGFSRSTVPLPVVASAPLVGNLGPVAAPSRDRLHLAYNTWHWAEAIDWQRSLAAQGIGTGDPLGRPQLHVVDLRDGADTALDPGSFSAKHRCDTAGCSSSMEWAMRPGFKVAVASADSSTLAP